MGSGQSFFMVSAMIFKFLLQILGFIMILNGFSAYSNSFIFFSADALGDILLPVVKVFVNGRKTQLHISTHFAIVFPEKNLRIFLHRKYIGNILESVFFHC